MKRVLGHCVAGLTLVATGVVLVSACVHDDSSLFIQNVLYPTPVTAGQTCSFTADPTQASISRGVLDTVFRQTYTPTVLVGNQLVPKANAQQLRTETSTINIQGATVRVTDTSGNQLNQFTTLASGTVYPSSGTTPGYAPISVTAIDQITVQNVVKSKAGTLSGGGTTPLVSYIKVFGHTLGGQYVESNEFEFPVDICTGCLIAFTASDVNTSPGYLQPNCLGNVSSGGTTSGSTLPAPCLLGQDTTVDCLQCQSYAPCRGAYANMMPPVQDAGTIDSGTVDSGTVDTGTVDTGTTDGGSGG